MARRRGWLTRARDLGVYVFLRAVQLLMGLVPVRLALGIGRALGGLTWLMDRRHRRTAEANAARALGLSAKEARRLVRRVYSNFGANFTEDLVLPRILKRKSLRDFARIEGEDHLKAALAKGKGAIVVTAHMGNWELGGLALAQAAGSALVIARVLSNPYVEHHTRAWRERAGLTVVGRRGALRRVIHCLQAGGCAGMLIDQNQRSGGVFVEFFGRLASTVPSPASIALKYDVPVLAACTYRIGRGSFHCFHCDPPFELIRTGDHKADIVANTAVFTRRIEEFVRAQPDQWFWLHSRWRKRPPDEWQAAEAPLAAEGAAAGSDIE